MAITDNTRILQGARASRNVNQATQMPDIMRKLMLLQPYQTPFTQFLFFGSMTSAPVMNAQGKFDWFEDQFLPHQISATAGVTPSSGQLTLTSSNVNLINVFKDGDKIYLEENDEEAVVLSITGGNVVLAGVADGVNQTRPNLTALTNGSQIKIIGNIQEEGGRRPDPRTTTKIERSNYLNLLKESIELTDRQIAGRDWIDGVDHAGELRKKISEVKLQLERQNMLSLKSGLTSGTNGRVTSYGRGAIGSFTTNVTTYSGSIAETDLDAHVQKMILGSNHKYHYAGSNQYFQIQQFLKAKQEIDEQVFVNEYGVQVTRYILGPVYFDLIWNPVLDGKFSNWGITIDPEYVKLRYMADDDKGSRKFRVRSNVQDNDEETKATVILTDTAPQFMNEETGGLLYQA